MSSTASTPAQLGYRMPAEWEPHQAVWFSWPHNQNSWPGKFATVEPVVTRAIRAICDSEPVHLNVLDAAHEAHVRALLTAAGTPPERISFHHHPTNDAWCRDHGAIFITREHSEHPLAGVHWGYNAWGGKYPLFDRDQQIPRRMTEYLNVPRFNGGMILEGGSIEVNGTGVLMTSEQCLLNQNRNPQLTRAQIEQRLRDFLGVQTILWLGEGIAGDDTDGHIDDITRFVAEDTILTMVEPDTADENHHPLADNLARLKSFRQPSGQPYRIIEVAMPEPVFYEGHRLPASYANFYIGNTVVLLPVFNCARDPQAIAALQGCFPHRKIVPIDCTDLVWGLGTFHCLSQQVPASG